MGRYIYDFLCDSFLSEQNALQSGYKNFTEKQLITELMRYRNYCMTNVISTEDDEPLQMSQNCLFPDDISIEALKQAALYQEKAILSDPLFKLTALPTEADISFSKFNNLPARQKVDRSTLSSTITRLERLRPLVGGNYLELLPLSYYFERGEKLPILYSKDRFASCLPHEILSEYHRAAKVQSVEFGDRAYIMNDLYPCRSINIMFEGMIGGFGMGYILCETDFKKAANNSFEMLLAKQKNSPTPTEEEFKIWIEQSINQTARNHFTELLQRVAIANKLNCLVSTEYQFESLLMDRIFKKQHSSIPENTFNGIMSMELPSLTHLSSENLMYIRNNDGESFKNFRVELEKTLRVARTENDPVKRQTLIEDAQHELFEVQATQIAPKMNALKKQVALEFGIGALGLAATIVSPAASWVATTLAALACVKTGADYLVNIRGNPCHLLWQLKKHNNKK